MKLKRIASFFALVSLLGSTSAQTYRIEQQYTIGDGLPSNIISCADQDSQGLLWLGTWHGLCWFDGYEFIPVSGDAHSSQPYFGGRIHSVRTDAAGNVWAVTYERRGIMLNTATHICHDFSSLLEQQFHTPSLSIRNVYPLTNGVVWTTCYESDHHTFRIGNLSDSTTITDEESRIPSGDKINQVVSDAQGREWVIGNHTIYLWEPGSAPFTKQASASDTAQIWSIVRSHRTRTHQLPEGVTEGKSFKKFFVDAQHNLWNLTPKLTRYTPVENRFTISNNGSAVPTRTFQTFQLASEHAVYAALTDSRGRLWIGTKGGGLYLVQQGTTRHFLPQAGDPYSLMGKDVYDIYEDSYGHIWIACYDGGFNLISEQPDGTIRFINGGNQLEHYPKGHFAKVRHVMESTDHVLFLSTADGIVCFESQFSDPAQIQFHTYRSGYDQGSLPGGNVMQVLQAQNGRIYLSTMSGGLVTIRSGNPLADDLIFESVAETQNTNGIVLSFVEDHDGCLWLGRETYLEKYDTRSGETMIFERKDFGQDVTFSEALPTFDSATHSITFGILGGTLSFQPQQLQKSNFVPNILFSTVQYQGEQTKHPILYTRELYVPSDRRNLNIFFSALDYQGSELIKYAYKLDGIDPDWNYVGTNHCASFNNLPCGHLKLLVRSTNADGVWVDNLTTLSIYSQPIFWETWWAKLLYVLIVALIVYVAVYIVQMRHRHQREREELERKLEALLANLQAKEEARADAPESVPEQAAAYALPKVETDSQEEIFMQKLLTFIDENLSNGELKIGDLSDHMLMSRSTFYDRLKSITGMSPVDFLRYLRIKRAKQYLEMPDVSISQIAYNTGFADPNYFSKTFKKATGLSPTEYRSQHGQ